MKLRFGSLISVLVLVSTATGFPLAALAQPISSPQISSSNTSNEFVQEFFRNDREFFRNGSLGRQLALIFGFDFPENEIAQDAELIDNLYEIRIVQQSSSDPIVRTRDLPNPYTTSILTSPRSNVNSDMQRSELIFEALPLRR